MNYRVEERVKLCDKYNIENDENYSLITLANIVILDNPLILDGMGMDMCKQQDEAYDEMIIQMLLAI